MPPTIDATNLTWSLLCPQTENIRDGVVTRSGPHRADIRCNVVPAEPFRPPAVSSAGPARASVVVARRAAAVSHKVADAPSRLRPSDTRWKMIAEALRLCEM